MLKDTMIAEISLTIGRVVRNLYDVYEKINCGCSAHDAEITINLIGEQMASIRRQLSALKREELECQRTER